MNTGLVVSEPEGALRPGHHRLPWKRQQQFFSPPAPGADRLVDLFSEEVEQGNLLVLDGGVLGNVPPSTLVDCTDPVPRLVREGAIPRPELRRAVGRLIIPRKLGSEP